MPRNPDAITPDGFWARLSGYLRPRDLIFADQGTSFYGALTTQLPAGAQLIGQPIWASIGYTLPAMLGAQLADRSRRTILVIGDGAAQMTIQELGTFSRLGLKPLVFILNNEGYTIERAIQNPDAPYHDITRWDWARLPAALGAGDDLMTRKVRSDEELDVALAQVTRSDRAAIVEVKMDQMARPAYLVRFLSAMSKGQQNKRPEGFPEYLRSMQHIEVDHDREQAPSSGN